MAFFDNGKAVTTGDAIVIWDGINSPQPNDEGKMIHSLKVAIVGASPERQEIETLIQTALDNSDFKGVMPPNGRHPIMQVDTVKLAADAALFAGRVAFNVKTQNGTPPTYDANGQVIPVTHLPRLLYPGAIVRVLLHAAVYDRKGGKGVGLYLDGIQVLDSTSPRLQVGGGYSASTVASAFAAAPPAAAPPAAAPPAAAPPAAAPPAAAPPAAAPPEPHTAFVQGKIMTEKAAGVGYDAFVAQGWTDDQLIANGYMVG